MPFILVLLKILFKENKFHKPRCPVCQSLKTIYQDSPKEGELSRETTICPDCTVGTINLYNYTLQQMDFDKPKDQLNTLIQNLYSITENSINMTKNLNDELFVNELKVVKAILLTKWDDNPNAKPLAEETIVKAIEYAKRTNNTAMFQKSLPILSMLNEQKASSYISDSISQDAQPEPAAPEPALLPGSKLRSPQAWPAPAPVSQLQPTAPASRP